MFRTDARNAGAMGSADGRRSGHRSRFSAEPSEVIFRSPRDRVRRILVVMADVTRILAAIETGDPKAAAELLPLVYDELRKLAAARLADETPGRPSSRPPWSTRPTSGWSGTAGRGTGTAGATSSRPRPRPCAASSSTAPATSTASSAVAAVGGSISTPSPTPPPRRTRT